MALLEINWKPDRRQLRGFGIAAAVFFAAVAGWLLWRGRLVGFEFSPGAAWTAATVLGGLALVCGALAAAAPKWLRPLYVGLSLVALPIGLVVSHVLLAIVYFGILTPLGLILRVVRGDPLTREFDRDAKTYWECRTPTSDVKRYFRQF